jgi:intracellular sulfur oxidation DsrE/DsrF family protein
MDNPTLPRLQALADAGVDLYLCGQSAGFRGLTMDKVGAPVKLSLSAMTMETILQNDGYRVISHDWPRLAR